MNGCPWVIILIHDTGPGIHGYDFKNVFLPGYTTKEEGVGLGLDIVKSIVEDIGGTVRVKYSTLFVGTTFEIMLPGAGNMDGGQ